MVQGMLREAAGGTDESGGPSPQQVRVGSETLRMGSLAGPVLALALAACSATEQPSGTAQDAADGPERAADATIEMVEMAFEPDRVEVPAGEAVEVLLVNAGSLRHDLVLEDGTDSGTLQADDSTLVEVGPLTGTVSAWCSVPGHREAGMEMEFVAGE